MKKISADDLLSKLDRLIEEKFDQPVFPSEMGEGGTVELFLLLADAEAFLEVFAPELICGCDGCRSAVTRRDNPWSLGDPIAGYPSEAGLKFLADLKVAIPVFIPLDEVALVGEYLETATQVSRAGFLRFHSDHTDTSVRISTGGARSDDYRTQH